MARETADGYGLGLITEVSSVNDIELVSKYADMIQVGAWNMRNTPLLRELGRQTKPVLLYRNIASGLEEFVEAANWIMSGGNRQVVLCDAGTKRFDGSARTVIDTATICELSDMTGLPILVDLRHAAKDQAQQVILATSMRSLPIAGMIIATEWHHSADDASLQLLSGELNQTIVAFEGPNPS
jgi:3-deoxy-7-phosphoheptulonate synthase